MKNIPPVQHFPAWVEQSTRGRQGRRPAGSTSGVIGDKNVELFKNVTCFLSLSASRSDVGCLFEDLWHNLTNLPPSLRSDIEYQWRPERSWLEALPCSAIHALWLSPPLWELAIIWWLETPNCLCLQANNLSCVHFWARSWIAAVSAKLNSHQMRWGLKSSAAHFTYSWKPP